MYLRGPKPKPTRARIPLNHTNEPRYTRSTQKPLVRHLNISASGPPQSRKMEPGALQWDSGAAMYRHDDVQRQLGATKDSVSLDDRGILAMDKDSFYDNLEKIKKMSVNNTEGFGNDTTGYMESALRVPLSISVLYCSGCPQTDDVLLSSIFLHGLVRDIIAETGSPAMALQAVNTILMRQIYHSFANAFTQPSVSELALIQAASVPVSRTGYIVVMGLIAAQLVIYLLVWLMFSRTKYSVLHNSWLTIAQVSETPEAAPLLARAGEMSSREVRKFAAGVQGGGETPNGGARRRYVLYGRKFS